MKITGTIHEVGETQQINESYKKRDLIVSYSENPQFTEYLKFEVMQDRVSLFDNLNVGEEVEVNFNLRGRPWTNRDGITMYFNTLQPWKIDKTNRNNIPPVDISQGSAEDDLPF